MEKTKKLIRLFLGIPATLLSFLFLGKVFFDNREILLSSLAKIDFVSFSIGILFFAAFFLLKSYVWVLILKNRNHKPLLRETLFQYSISEIKRYIPGSVFAFIGRVDSHLDTIEKKETLKGIGIEALLMVVSALFVSLPGIIYFFPYSKVPVLSIIFVFFLFLIFDKKKFFYKYLNCFLLLVIAWVFYGISSLFIANSLINIINFPLILLLSFFVLSWLGGYLFFISPMGLGVRELIITFALSIFIANPIAAAVAILTRIGMSLGEILNLIITFSFFKLKSNNIILKLNPYFALVCIMSTVYFLLFSYLSFIKHDALLSGRFDLGNMTQTVWNTANGRFFTLTNPDGVDQVSRLAVHSDFILVLFAPFYLLWSDPKVLLIFQSFFMATGGIFVFLIAKQILKNDKISLVISISYFLNFWLHEQNLFDFHAVTLATPLLLAAFYFLINKRYIWFGILLFLATLTKENVFLTAAFFGLYFYFFEKRKILGLALFTTCLLIFYFLSSFAIPQARGEAHFVLSNYDYLGNSITDVLKNAILKPGILINQLFNFSTLNYFYTHLLPLGFLSVLSPFYLLFTLPEVAIYLLTKNFEYRSYHYHFGAVFLPFLYISCIYSLKRLMEKFKNRDFEIFFIYYLSFFTIISAYFFSPLAGMHQQDLKLFEGNKKQILKNLEIIKENDSVAATNNIGAHLSHRENIYVVPYGMEKASFIVLYNEKQSIIDNVNHVEYELWKEDKGLLIYKRKIVNSCGGCKP